MIERDYGKLSGTSKKGYEKKHGKSAFDAIHRGYLTGPPGGESLADVEKRVDPFIKELLRFIKKHKVNVAVSAHGNSMRPFRKHFEKLSIKKMCSIENPWDNYFRYRVRV